MHRWSGTLRFALPIGGILFLLYLGGCGLSYFRLKSADYPPLTPSSRFNVLGFPAEIVQERRWKIIITHEVPHVYEVWGEEKFQRPDPVLSGAADQAATRKRVPLKEVLAVCPVVLTGKHVQKAWIERREGETLRASPYYYVVHLRLTEEGKGRFWHYATQHVGERLLVVIGDQSWAAPLIKGEVASPWWLLTRLSPFERSDLQIQPIYDEEIATTLAEGAKP